MVYIPTGLIEHYDDRDYMLGGEAFVTIIGKKNNSKRIVRTNQNRHPHQYSCTIFSILSSIAYNTSVPITIEDIDNASREAIEQGIVIHGVGARFDKAVNFCKKRVLHNYNRKLTYYRIEGNDPLLSVLAKEWAINVGYNANRSFVDDTEPDGIATQKSYKRGFGHLVHTYYDSIVEDNTQHYLNSYEGVLQYNQFIVRHWQDLRHSQFWSRSAYLFVDLENMTNEQFEQDKKMIEKAYQIGITNNKKNVVDIQNGNYTTDVRMLLFVMRSRDV